MYGIVSPLDPSSTNRVERLWQLLRDGLGLDRGYEQRIPHLSYHVAPHYDAAQVQAALGGIAATVSPMLVRTAGLALFTEPHPVLHIPVTGSPALRHLHELLWNSVEPLAESVIHYYQPETWVPHITLAMDDLPPAQVPNAVRLLLREPLEWDVVIHQIAFCRDDGRRQDLEQVYSLAAR